MPVYKQTSQQFAKKQRLLYINIKLHSKLHATASHDATGRMTKQPDWPCALSCTWQIRHEWRGEKLQDDRNLKLQIENTLKRNFFPLTSHMIRLSAANGSLGLEAAAAARGPPHRITRQ